MSAPEGTRDPSRLGRRSLLMLAALVAAPGAGCDDKVSDTGGLLSLHREGGLKGTWGKIRVDEDGTFLTRHETSDETEGRLPAEELERLRDLLSSVDFRSLPGGSVSDSSTDRYLYRLTHQGHTITTDMTRKLGAVDEIIIALNPRLAAR
ncbi:hypothetical protein GCM10027168_70570 [Streptomyces capparidis]